MLDFSMFLGSFLPNNFNGNANVFNVGGNGNVNNNWVTNMNGLRPAISQGIIRRLHGF